MLGTTLEYIRIENLSSKVLNRVLNLYTNIAEVFRVHPKKEDAIWFDMWSIRKKNKSKINNKWE